MGQTLAQTSDRIRWLLNDVDASNAVVSSARLDRLINDTMQALSQRIPYYRQELENITLVTGTRDYALTSANQYARIVEIRRAEDNWPLQKVSHAVMTDQVYLGRTGSSETFFLFEAPTTNVLTVRVDPIPSATESGDLLRVSAGIVPETLVLQSDSIPFSDPLLRVLEKQVAACVISGATQEQMARIGLSPGIAEVWYREAERGTRDERVRLNRLRRIATLERREA